MKAEVKRFREEIEKTYQRYPTRCGGGFGELLCFEIHDEPVNPRMRSKTFNDGFSTGLTFTELAQKWGISVTFLGELIADHCKRMEK